MFRRVLGIVLLTGIMSAALGCGPKLENKANFQAKPGEPAATTETGGKLAGPKQ